MAARWEGAAVRGRVRRGLESVGVIERADARLLVLGHLALIFAGVRCLPARLLRRPRLGFQDSGVAFPE